MPKAEAAWGADTLRVTGGAPAGSGAKSEPPGLPRGTQHGRAGTPQDALRDCSGTPSQEPPAGVPRPPPQRSGSDPRPRGTSSEPGGITRTEGPDAAGEGRRARHGSVPAGRAAPLRAPPPLPGEGEAEAALRALALRPPELLQSPPQHPLLLPSPARSIPVARDSSDRSAQAPQPPPPSRPAPGTASDLPGRGARTRGWLRAPASRGAGWMPRSPSSSPVL